MRLRHLVPIAAVLAGCQAPDAAITTPATSAGHAVAVDGSPHASVARVVTKRLPVEQLAEARRATARYHDYRNAVADGYEDINVVLPNMGRHFLKAGFLDGRFDAESPELLVYSEERGHLKLVAVEYAVPLSESATAPEGFAGDADGWFPDSTFHLWTLHAWVWKPNPEGVFYPTNVLVP